MHTDGSDLCRRLRLRLCLCPCSGKALYALTGNPEIAASADQHFLQPSNIIHGPESFTSRSFTRRPRGEAALASKIMGTRIRTQIAVERKQFMFAQIKYRVPHQLTRSMKRNVAPAVALENLHTASRQCFGRSEHVSRLRVASEGNDGRVLEEEESVADLS